MATSPLLTMIDGVPVAQYPDGSIVPINMAAPPINQTVPPAMEDALNEGAAGGTSPLLPTGQDGLVGGGYGTPRATGRLSGDQPLPPADRGGVPGGSATPLLDIGAVPVPGDIVLPTEAGDGGGDGSYREPVTPPRHYEPQPVYNPYRGDGGGGGGGRTPTLAGGLATARSRLAGAKARLSSAIGGGGGGGYSSGGSMGGGSGGGTGVRELRGPWAEGMDPTQAAGLGMVPSAMIPTVFPGLDPSSPEYERIAALPLAGMATLMGNGKGTTQALANNLGRLVERAGTTGNLVKPGKMFRNLSQPMDMFEGQKAGRGGMESYTVPGYEYGGEPLLMGEATTAMGGLLDAALAQEPLATQQKYGSEGWGGYLMDKWASRAMKRKPGKGPEVNEYVTKRLYRSG